MFAPRPAGFFFDRMQSSIQVAQIHLGIVEEIVFAIEKYLPLVVLIIKPKSEPPRS